MKEKSVLILGAGSGIGRAVACEYAKNGFDLILTARNPAVLESLKSDLKLRFNCSVQLLDLDFIQALDPVLFSERLERLPLGVVSCIGHLCDEEACRFDINQLQMNLRINAEGPMIFLECFAEQFVQRGFGFVVAISSVAADRGRAKNGFYGSAKAMLSTYLSALRNRMFKYNVFVTDVRPGFVRTPMTAHLKLPEFLLAEPAQVAKDIYKSQQRCQDLLYTPWFWYWIMLIIRNIPEFIFKRMKI